MAELVVGRILPPEEQRRLVQTGTGCSRSSYSQFDSRSYSRKSRRNTKTYRQVSETRAIIRAATNLTEKLARVWHDAEQEAHNLNLPDELTFFRKRVDELQREGGPRSNPGSLYH